MDVLSQYGLADTELQKIIAEHLGVDCIHAFQISDLTCLNGENDYFMSNIQKLKVKAFIETGQGIATVKSVNLIVKRQIDGFFPKVLLFTIL